MAFHSRQRRDEPGSLTALTYNLDRSLRLHQPVRPLSSLATGQPGPVAISGSGRSRPVAGLGQWPPWPLAAPDI